MEKVYGPLIMLVTMVFSLVFTGIEIPILKRKQFGQFIREEGPSSHLSKQGTPTMGGVAIYLAITLASLLSLIAVKGVRAGDMLILIVAGAAFGLIGFMDDYIKVVKKHNLGLTALQKLMLQIAFSVAFACYLMYFTDEGSGVWIPLLNKQVDIGIMYIPFVSFVMVAMANAVNLTDGLDGLCAGVSGIVAFFFAVIGISFHQMASSNYLFAIAGACIGFLVWNYHPAKIFMGDTGSMALGAGITAATIMMRTELLIPVAGLLFVIEAMSVIIQVVYFKKTGGKRFFRMAPIHHHFELGGMSEQNVVLMFWGFAAICSLVAMLISKVG